MNLDVCIGVYYLLLVLFGVSQYFLVQPPDSVDINWFKNIISEIEIVQYDKPCSEYFSPLISYYWPGIKSGYLCENKVYENASKLKNTQNCQKLRDIPAKQFDKFALKEPSHEVVQPFKMCGKIQYSTNLFTSLSLEEEVCNSVSQKVCIFEGRVLCAEKNIPCEDEISKCNEEKKLCKYKSTVLCVEEEQECPEYESVCNSDQKSCLIKERVICINQEDNCPITDIIVRREGELIPQSYEQISTALDNSEWRFFVKRENLEESAIVEFQISSSFGVCLNRNQTTEKNLNSLEKQQPCKDLTDTRFLKFLQNSITAKQLYQANKVVLAEHGDYIPANQKYDLYFRRYFGYSSSCNFSSQDITRIFSLQSSIKDFSLGFFWCSIVLLISFIDLKRLQSEQRVLERNSLYYTQEESKKTRNYEMFYSWHIGIYIINLFYITCLQICIYNVNREISPLLGCDDNYLQRDISQYILENEGEEIINFLTFLYWFPIILFLYKVILKPRVLKCKCFHFVD